MKWQLILITYMLSGWGCNTLTERPASTLAAFTSSSGASLCTIASGGKTIDMRGLNKLPIGFVIDGDAVGIDAKGRGEWKKGAEILGKYKIYREKTDDKYVITLKWTDGASHGSPPLSSSTPTLQHIEYLTITSKNGTTSQNLYTYHSGHNGEAGTPPSC